jgi:hypothetical protein
MPWLYDQPKTGENPVSVRVDERLGAVVPSPGHDVKRREGRGSPRPPETFVFPREKWAPGSVDVVWA